MRTSYGKWSCRAYLNSLASELPVLPLKPGTRFGLPERIYLLLNLCRVSKTIMPLYCSLRQFDQRDPKIIRSWRVHLHPSDSADVASNEGDLRIVGCVAIVWSLSPFFFAQFLAIVFLYASHNFLHDTDCCRGRKSPSNNLK